MYGIGSAVRRTMNAVEKLRAAIAGDARLTALVDALVGEVECGVELALFRTRDAAGGPFHRATFGGVPHPPAGRMFPRLAGLAADLAGARDPEPLTALALAMESLQRALVYAADSQEYVDANLNSAQYLRAAGHLDVAEPMLLELARSWPRSPG